MLLGEAKKDGLCIDKDSDNVQVMTVDCLKSSVDSVEIMLEKNKDLVLGVVDNKAPFSLDSKNGFRFADGQSYELTATPYSTKDSKKKEKKKKKSNRRLKKKTKSLGTAGPSFSVEFVTSEKC